MIGTGKRIDYDLRKKLNVNHMKRFWKKMVRKKCGKKALKIDKSTKEAKRTFRNEHKVSERLMICTLGIAARCRRTCSSSRGVHNSRK